MAYCVDADVIAAGAAGAGPFASQIAEAKERIDRFCGDTFESTPNLTVIATFGAGGIAPLPRRVQSITSVTLIGSSSPIDTSAWRLRTATVPGDVDAIELLYGYDDLVVGAERYNGGWLNLGRPGARLAVLGTFGPAAVPATIKTLSAKLAAWLADNAQYGAGDPGGVRSLTTEGYSVTFDTDRLLTTGLPEVDRMLIGQGYRRIQFA